MVPVLILFMAVLVAADEVMTDLSAPENLVAVHCDASHVCPDYTTCCRNPFGRWSCCPVPMGQCCRDGRHCCRHGYHCDFTSSHCKRGWLKLPSFAQLPSIPIQKPAFVLADQALEWQNQAEMVQCVGNVYCSAEKFCCKTPDGQWGCCSGDSL